MESVRNVRENYQGCIQLGVATRNLIWKYLTYIYKILQHPQAELQGYESET